MFEEKRHTKIVITYKFLWMLVFCGCSAKKSQLKFQAASCYQTIHQLACGKTIGVTPWPQ